MSKRDVNLSYYRHSVSLYCDVLARIQPQSRQEVKQVPLPVGPLEAAEGFISSNQRKLALKMQVSARTEELCIPKFGGIFHSVIKIIIITIEFDDRFQSDSKYLGKVLRLK